MPDSAQTKVLLVDDDPHITVLFKAILENDGFEVLTAADGSQALSIALEKPIACVITDLTMPRLDGFGLIAALSKELPRTAGNSGHWRSSRKQHRSGAFPQSQ